VLTKTIVAKGEISPLGGIALEYGISSRNLSQLSVERDDEVGETIGKLVICQRNALAVGSWLAGDFIGIFPCLFPDVDKLCKI
jgi:hypothetical protein